MGDKNQIQLRPIISWVLGVGILAFIVLILAIIFNVIPSDSISFSTTSSSNDTILVESTSILSPLGRGITTSSVTANDFTWLNFDGVNDQVDATKLDIETNKNWTVLGWFNWINNTADNTHTFLGNGFGNNRTRCGIKTSQGKFVCAIGNGTSGMYWGSTSKFKGSPRDFA